MQLRTTACRPLRAFQADLPLLRAMLPIVRYLKTKDIGTYINLSTFSPLLWTFSKKILKFNNRLQVPRKQMNPLQLVQHWKDMLLDYMRTEFNGRQDISCFRQNRNHIWNYNKTVATFVPQQKLTSHLAQSFCCACEQLLKSTYFYANAKSHSDGDGFSLNSEITSLLNLSPVSEETKMQ